MKDKMMPSALMQKKQTKQKIIMLTAYDYTFASLMADLVDVILVGDSLANVFQGLDTTLSVTMAQLIYHTQAVSRGAGKALVVADLPFLSYHISPGQAIENAGRMLKEGGAQAVKMEVAGQACLAHIAAVIDAGIPVIGHVGFTPQTVYKLGGFRVQGREAEEAQSILEAATQLEKIGCSAIVLELVPGELAKQVTSNLKIPTIGIGAGPDCDGQVLVAHDLLGLTNFYPKYLKKYADLQQVARLALKEFKKDVAEGHFPTQEHTY